MSEDAPHVWKPPFRWDEYDGVCRDADNWAVPVPVLAELLTQAQARCAEEVYVLESGEYEQRSIWGIFSSLDACATFLKMTYGQPYIVRWDNPVQNDDDSWQITGHFTRVEGFSGDGPIVHEVTRYAIDAALKEQR